MRTLEQQAALGRRVLDYIAAHPEQHDQTSFGEKTACGTTMCIAGTACFLDEDTKIDWIDNQFLTGVKNITLVSVDDVKIDAHAAELLGLRGGGLIGNLRREGAAGSQLSADTLFYMHGNEHSVEALTEHVELLEAAVAAKVKAENAKLPHIS